MGKTATLGKMDLVKLAEKNATGQCRKFDKLASLALRNSTQDVVTRVYSVTLCELQRDSRGPAKAALARQIAMYLSHVIFGISMHDVGMIFNRDRTTVAHACALIEDRRDDRCFDWTLEILGCALLLAFRDFEKDISNNP